MGQWSADPRRRMPRADVVLAAPRLTAAATLGSAGSKAEAISRNAVLRVRRDG